MGVGVGGGRVLCVSRCVEGDWWEDSGGLHECIFYDYGFSVIFSLNFF